MALMRGVRSKFPCPTCLVPVNQLSSFDQSYLSRVDTESIAIVRQAIKMERHADREALLKSHGLRGIEVCYLIITPMLRLSLPCPQNVFWSIAHSDPHAAISWDRLHAFHGGLFGDHIWSEIKKCLNALGRCANEDIDSQYGHA